MKILFTIPHYFRPSGEQTTNKSNRTGAKPERTQALLNTIYSILRTFGTQVYALDHSRELAWQCPIDQQYEIDIVVCTTGTFHLLEDLAFVNPLITHHNTDAEPTVLGYECHKILAEKQQEYDYFCYVEDDVAVTDNLMFNKLALFSQQFGDEVLLQPNRYELALNTAAHKLYCDYHIHPDITSRYQDVSESSEIFMDFLGEQLRFVRTCYPSAGSFFLNQRQMKIFMDSAAFMDGDHSYFSSLDSAATLGITKTFTIYKPALSNADFFEVMHSSPRWIGMIGKQVKTGRWEDHPDFPWRYDDAKPDPGQDGSR